MAVAVTFKSGKGFMGLVRPTDGDGSSARLERKSRDDKSQERPGIPSGILNGAHSPIL